MSQMTCLDDYTTPQNGLMAWSVYILFYDPDNYGHKC